MPAHFEIHVNDMDRAKAFYGTVLGWSFSPMDAGSEVDYHLVHGDGIGPGKPLSGGLLRRADASPAPGGPIRGCTLTFDVENTDDTYETALANGGAEALPPMDFPGIGRAAYCEDGQGNVFGFITPAAKES